MFLSRRRDTERDLAVRDAECDALRVRVEQLEDLVAYWRSRAERLIDAGLARRGEITAPVMETAKPQSTDPIGGLFAGLGVETINRQHSAPGQVVSSGEPT